MGDRREVKLDKIVSWLNSVNDYEPESNKMVAAIIKGLKDPKLMDKETESVLNQVRTEQPTKALVFIRGSKLVIQLAAPSSAEIYAPLTALVADIAPGH